MPSALALMLLVVATLSEGYRVPNNYPRASRAHPFVPQTRDFSRSELQCLMEDKVLYTDGNCYPLRHTGPCGEREWLVLDKDDAPLVSDQGRRLLMCQPVPCNGTFRVFWPEDNQCHTPSDVASLCPHEGNELRSDSYGEGECACQASSARFKPEILRVRNTAEELEGTCYRLFHRGPCPMGKILFPEILDGFGVVAECFDDYCPQENIRDPSHAYVRDIMDGQCYQLGSQGPCSSEETYNVDPVTYKPQCVNNVISVFGGEADPCGGDYYRLSRQCREKVDFKIKSMSFVYEVRGLRFLRRSVLTPRIGDDM